MQSIYKRLLLVKRLSSYILNNTMSMNIINPVSSKSTYTQNDKVDFNIVTKPGESIVKNSIRITGLLKVSNGATNIKSTDIIYYDPTCGVSGVFQQIICSTQNQGVIETNMEYPRYVKSKMQAAMTPSQLASASSNLTELRCGSYTMTNSLLARSSKVAGFTNKTTGALVDAEYTSFSMKPDICFNKSDNHIANSKTGQLNINLRLSTNNQFLFGSGVGTTYSYTLKNLQIQYNTIPQDVKGPLTMEKIIVEKNKVESNNSQLSTSVPAICRSVSCVFHEDSTLNTSAINSLENQYLPAIERVEFSWNGDNEYISYTLKYPNELLYNYVDSWGDYDKTGLSNNLLNVEGDGFGIGLDFKSYVDLSNQKFGLNIVSNVSSTRAYAIFMIFKGIVTI